ncbi:MAG: 1-acyl-sn-glycerol-3-phosphate acyltransferase [Spirochaetaceae bacterium]|nr:1-acyl-sn-glycerol-3-phosphate acyltransferase [Spirochaetaceae bacterium]
MPYKHGRPIIDSSLPFRIATALTFYTVWPIAQLANWLHLSTRFVNRRKLSGFSRAILVSNHTTFLDPVIVSGMVLPRRTWQTLLEATVEAPFLGTFTRLLGGIPIPRGKAGFRKLLDSADLAFKYRRFIHFYPEGECFLYSQRIREFRPGAFRFAAELDIPVIPLVTVFHEGPFKPWSFLGRSVPRETIVALDPVYPAGYIKRDGQGEISSESVKVFAQAVREIMQNEINTRHGSSAFFRGRMDRLKGINA